LATPGIEVATLLIAGDDVVWVAWRHSEETHVLILRHRNEVIASFVTAGDRLHLYGYLDSLKERALYCDTDNVIYVHPTDGTAMEGTGDCLGAMTSELKPDEIISEFVSGGQKNYAYKTFNLVTGVEKTICKVRGITLNYSAS
jgi:hypothetical protein